MPRHIAKFASVYLLLFVCPRNPYCPWHKTIASAAGIHMKLPLTKCDLSDRLWIVTPPEFSRNQIESLLTAASAATGCRGSFTRAPTLSSLQIALNSFGSANIAAAFPSPSALSSLRAQNPRASGTTRIRKRVPTALQETPSISRKSIPTKPLSNQATLPVCSI